MNTLLVLSTGQTDVQLVVDDIRQELNKKRCGELHDLIKQRVNEWKLVDAPTSKGDEAEALPDGQFQLCTPKLDAVLQHLSDTDPKSIKALILDTRRQSHLSDPRFAGAILERRLRERGVSDVSLGVYLQEDDRDYDDKSNSKDAIIRRDVVSRIDEEVRKTMSKSINNVVVASTGGPPVITSLIDEVVRLHAGSVKCDLIEIEDGARKRPPSADRTISRSTWDPQESFRARRHALELINKGNLLAAWGSVQHLDDDIAERQWTQVIKWLADFAASLPISDKCDIVMLNHHRLAVRAALRVELALRARDIPRAVHGTVAFFECAFWDWLREYDFGAEGITKRSDHVYQLPSNPSSDMKERFMNNKDDQGNKDGTYHINDFQKGINIWLPKLNKPALEALWRTMTDEIRNLRNDIAHNEPTASLMRDSKSKMDGAGLWSNDDRFLKQPLVSNVLTELGVSRSTEICADLIKTVGNRLLNPIADK